MPWADIKHLFQPDDGSLPDIFVENLSETEMADVYEWVTSIAKPYGDPSVWSVTSDEEVKLRELQQSAAAMLIAGEIQPFRHALELFEYEGVTLPQLSIAIESKSTLSFDYRMGSGWGESEANALLKFLSGIAVIAPKSKVSQAWEGCEKRNKEFEDELHRISAA